VFLNQIQFDKEVLNHFHLAVIRAGKWCSSPSSWAFQALLSDMLRSLLRGQTAREAGESAEKPVGKLCE